MPRATRSDIGTLLQETRAIEMLMNEADVPPHRLQEYWALSADLMVLVTDIEEQQASNPNSGYDDPIMFTLKHRLREVISRLAELQEDEQ